MSATPSAARSSTDARRRTPVQTASLIVGVVFLLVGVLGFIPGITTNYGALAFAGPHSTALLLGVFQVSILHNIVHLLFGVLGVLAARTASAARSFLIIGGAVYLVLFVYGLLVPHGSAANFVPMNGSDHVLHLILGLGMIALGLVLGRRVAGAGTTGRTA